MYIHGIESKTDTSPHSYEQLIFIFTKKPNKHTEKNWQHIQQGMLVKRDSCIRRMLIEPHLLPCTKPNTKWIQGVNKHKLLNLIEEKVGNKLGLIGARKIFLNRTPILQALRPKISK